MRAPTIAVAVLTACVAGVALGADKTIVVPPRATPVANIERP
jgi:hypothetical protein